MGFTSGLSVADFALTRLGIVASTSVFYIVPSARTRRTAIAPHGEHVPLGPQTILRLGATTRA